MADAHLDHAGVVVACSTCGRANRLRFSTLDRATRCGQCHAPLHAPAAPVEVTSTETFDAAVSASALPIVVDFWAPWCGPCRAMAPELARAAHAMAGRCLVLKVNTDELQDLADRFRIRSIPTLALLGGGREFARVSGVRSAADIEALCRSSFRDATR